MPSFKVDKEAPIFVEWTPRVGTEEVPGLSAEAPQKSASAVASAMNTIHHVARRVSSTINALSVQPTQVELAFGLNFDQQLGALIARRSNEAAVNIRLKWDLK